VTNAIGNQDLLPLEVSFVFTPLVGVRPLPLLRLLGLLCRSTELRIARIGALRAGWMGDKNADGRMSQQKSSRGPQRSQAILAQCCASESRRRHLGLFPSGVVFTYSSSYRSTTGRVLATHVWYRQAKYSTTTTFCDFVVTTHEVTHRKERRFEIPLLLLIEHSLLK